MAKQRAWVQVPPPTWQLTSNSKRFNAFFWPPRTPDTHMAHRRKSTHEIKHHCSFVKWAFIDILFTTVPRTNQRTPVGSQVLGGAQIPYSLLMHLTLPTLKLSNIYKHSRRARPPETNQTNILNSCLWQSVRIRRFKVHQKQSLRNLARFLKECKGQERHL